MNNNGGINPNQNSLNALNNRSGITSKKSDQNALSNNGEITFDHQDDSGELTSDAPVSVGFRFTPIQLARYEALIEKVHRSRLVKPGMSREELLLTALDHFLDPAPADEECASSRDQGDKTPAKTKVSPRRHTATPYTIVVYKCDTCQEATVQTNRGMTFY